MIYVVSSFAELKKNLNEYMSLNPIPQGKKLKIEISEFKENRSNAQNRYYFMFNTWVSDFLNDAGCTYGEYNIPYNKNIVHDINKKLFGYDTTTKMNVQEFCDYIEKIAGFWIEKTNGAFEVPELPESYLEKQGYTKEYRRE